MEVGFSYGLFGKPLKEQAAEQGLTLKDDELLEKLRESINWLRMHDILTNSQSDAAYKKLHKKVLKSLKPIKKRR